MAKAPKVMSEQDMIQALFTWRDQYTKESVAWLKAAQGGKKKKATDDEFKAYAHGVKQGWTQAIQMLKLHGFIVEVK